MENQEGLTLSSSPTKDTLQIKLCLKNKTRQLKLLLVIEMLRYLMGFGELSNTCEDMKNQK